MRKLARRDDDGFTLLPVLAAMVLVLGLVLVGIGYAVATHRVARASQDTKSAAAAAQAGLQDYIYRVNACSDYYAAAPSCGTTTANPALRTAATDTNFAVVPGSAGVTQGVFSQRVLASPAGTTAAGTFSTSVRVQVIGQVLDTVTGKVRESRTLVADLSRKGFLEYLYFTDYETFSPANTRLLKGSFSANPSSNTTVTSTSGTTYSLSSSTTYTVAQPTVDQVAAGCRRYYYKTTTGGATVPGRANFPRTITGGSLPSGGIEYWPSGSTSVLGSIANYQCLTISFSGADTFDGKVHSNDAMSISGPVLFKKDVTTGYKPSSGNPWYGASNPSTSGKSPVWAQPFELPKTTDKQADVAAAGGCLYTGPTSITFLADGRMKVLSPKTKANTVKPSCTTGSGASYMTSEQTVAGPVNGVIYVQKTTESGSCISYQNTAGDVTNYDNNGCTAGDAFVQGTVNGRFTVTAAHDVVVTGDLLYSDWGADGDVLGLIGTNNVAVWNPVNSSGNNLTSNGNREIDAAIASTGNSFTVFNYSSGAKRGNLTVRGVIVQRFRGPVATGSGTTTSTGYSKDYRYDDRLNSNPPPAFIQPEYDAWDISRTTVVQQNAN
ncbi:hypothetical protein [Kineococcus rhizosphaerae]|uniref:Uncharacterized protein n=1 Tax=Kineococcus rhizosphaerae TaxID=559628 RepID=A0A2T0R9R2_9ACTN|nr:hypothetical protein [Kineococcus rhizosphaerae]PRY17909.1 hypothetical protein CLV37_101151 [Kineococcus rhizosphaerae]